MLTGKQRSYLRGLANTQRSIVQVGKDGLSYNLTASLDTALEAHELVKVNVLKTCPENLKELAFDLAAHTHSEVVQQIGRTIIFYRRSEKPAIVLP